MKRITYEDLLAHPELRIEIYERARRERAAAMHRYLFMPLKSLFRAGRLTPAPRGLKYHRA